MDSVEVVAPEVQEPATVVENVPTPEAPVEEAAKPEEQPDIGAMLDFTRTARQEQLQKAGDILGRALARPDKKLSAKGEIKLVEALVRYSGLLEMSYQSAIESLYRTVQAISGLRSDLFGLSLNIETIIRDLESKGLVNTAELQQRLEKEILPKQMEALKQARKAAAQPAPEAPAVAEAPPPTP